MRHMADTIVHIAEVPTRKFLRASSPLSKETIMQAIIIVIIVAISMLLFFIFIFIFIFIFCFFNTCEKQTGYY